MVVRALLMRHFNAGGCEMSRRGKRNGIERTEGSRRNVSEAPLTVGFGDLRTVRQLASMNPAFSEASLRWLIFNAEKNGLDCALVKPGRRVLIDIHEFERWLEERRVTQLSPESIRVESA